MKLFVKNINLKSGNRKSSSYNLIKSDGKENRKILYGWF